MQDSPTGTSETKKATVNGLAVIGFIGIVIAGMLLAVYASRYVPQLLNNLSSAVYLSSDKPKNATTTPAKPTVTTPAPVITPEPSAPAPATTTPPAPPSTGGPYVVQPPRVIQSGPRLYGYPDLVLSNVQAGYWNGSSLIEDDRIPTNRDMALRFTVRNAGTNAVSGWLVRVRIEGQSDALAQGGLLYPNGSQTFSLRATDLDSGNTSIRIDVDYNNAVAETSESNNSDSLDVDVGGSSSGSSSRNVSCDIEASDTSVNSGDRITLSWDTSGNPNYASINQGVGRVDEDGGDERVTVDEDTTYRLTVRNSDGDEDTCSVTVRAD